MCVCVCVCVYIHTYIHTTPPPPMLCGMPTYSTTWQAKLSRINFNPYVAGCSFVQYKLMLKV